MWVLSGPFDGHITGDCEFQTTRLLKTGKSYPLSRKDAPLIVNSKKISKEHCEFKVSGWSISNVSDPQSTPLLQVFNQRDGKTMTLIRDGQPHVISGKSSKELKDGDQLLVANTVAVNINWQKLCCYVPLDYVKAVPIESCALLGIHVVHSHEVQVTHHLTQSYTMSPAIASSLLLACQFVKPEWLRDVVKGHEDDAPKPLELLSTTKFRPTYSPSLPSHLKSFNIWEPNEERPSIFLGFRFLFLSERGRLDQEWVGVISRAGASYEGFAIGTGQSQFSQTIAKCRRKLSSNGVLVVVANDVDMKCAIGEREWKEFQGDIKSAGLRLVTKETIIEAIIRSDTSMLRPDASDTQSSLPNCVPNTHSLEPSVIDDDLSPPRKKLTRRATASRQASQEPESSHFRPLADSSERTSRGVLSRKPSEEPDAIRRSSHLDIALSELSPRPVRKALTRRAAVTRTQDVEQATQSEVSQKPMFMVPLDLDTPAPPRSMKLKRRIDAVESKKEGLPLVSPDNGPEPPLKKYKALFDSTTSGISRMESVDETVALQIIDAAPGGSSTQTQTQEEDLRYGPSLHVVREEEEESQSVRSNFNLHCLKRKATEGDAEIAQVEDLLRPPLKRRALNININTDDTSAPTLPSTQLPLVQIKPTSTANPSAKKKSVGAAPGKPDVDVDFLKAIASTKRGKKAEDQFDREFNQLKISKPEIEQRPALENDWAVLDKFGDDTAVRGNFMMVVEMDLFRRDATEARRCVSASATEQWYGRQNFKKFKKKNTDLIRQIVPLVLSEDGGYGNAVDASKDIDMSIAPLTNDGDLELDEQPAPLVKPRGRSVTSNSIAPRKVKGRPVVIDDSDDDMDESEELPPRPSQRRSVAWENNNGKRNATTPLFLDSDQEEPSMPQADNDDSDDVAAGSLPRTRSRAPSVALCTQPPLKVAKGKSKKPVRVIMEDDSDDGAFKGFGKRRR